MKSEYRPSLLLALIILNPALAQEKTATIAEPIVQAAPDLGALTVGLKLREDAVTKLLAGSEKGETTIARLKSHASPSGLKIDRDGDFAFAAIDVGQRLVAQGSYAEAEKLFREAEKSLLLVIAKTPDTAKREKATYLQKLALIRSEYLNKLDQAKNDISAARALLPEDKYLASLEAHQASSRGDLLTKGGSK